MYKVLGAEIDYPALSVLLKTLGLQDHSVLEGLVNHYFTKWLRPGDVAVDCGAMHGWHTFDMAKSVTETGAVHAIDALHEHCEFLRRRAVDWDMDRQVIVHEAALSDHSGEARFIRVPRDAGYSGLRPGWIAEGEPVEEIPVRLATLDELIPPEHAPEVRFVKLDLQGGEFHAIRGAARLLAGARPLIALEWGRWSAAEKYDYTKEDFFGLLARLGYRLFDILGAPATAETFDLPFAACPVEFLAVPTELADGDIHAWGLQCLMSQVAERRAAAPAPATAPAPVTAAAAQDHDAEEAELEEVASAIAASGVFEDGHYLHQAGADVGPGRPAILHYLRVGEARGLKPNPYFDPTWYARKYLPPAHRGSALAHYLTDGDAQGFKPCAVFDGAWYAEFYRVVPRGGAALQHYLANRRDNIVNPNPYFDVAHYLVQNPDVRAANVDGFEHWLNWGLFEGRPASPTFDAGHVWKTYLGNQRQLNPFTTFMDIGADLGWDPSGAAEQSLHRLIAHNAAPGPQFEELGAPAPQPPAAKIVALYLTQFHAIPENDAWWGAGFTEWRNIPRGLPRYAGHYQPRIPRDLGFYTLDNTAIMRRQAELARRMGLHGFCFYYYNFNGHRLLEKPLDAYVDDAEIDFPFCLMWANENWTRRWDGAEADVLMAQDYRAEDMPALLDDLARYMTRPNYMRNAEGRPFLFLYRADVIPDCARTLAAWRAYFAEAHGLNPIISMSQSFDVVDPRPLAFDGAVEFPPHKLGARLPQLNHRLEILDPDFTGQIRDYDAIIAASLEAMDEPFPLLKTAFPSWDNDARRQGRGLSFAHSSPAAFRRWMEALIGHAQRRPFFGERLVFVNAWNEWCEGAYLEPDVHYGYAYLNALAAALRPQGGRRVRVLLVGHDAFPAGAQMLLLNIGRTLVRRFGLEIGFLLLGGGALEPQYRALAETCVAAAGQSGLYDHLGRLRREGWSHALTNTVVSGGIAAALDELGFTRVSMVHELPTIVRERGLEPAYAQLRAGAGRIVYPNEFVKSHLDSAFGPAEAPATVRPQGLYATPRPAPGARAAIRAELGLPADARIVLNLGYADLRKGVDLFLAIAAQMAERHADVHFVWVGDIDPGTRVWLELDRARRGLTRLHFLPFAPDVSRHLHAADLLLLTSREDPFPSVVLEALACGLPVAAFEQSGGHVDLLREEPGLGVLMPYGDIGRSAALVARALADPGMHAPSARERRRALVATRFDFTDYCADLIGMLAPGWARVSVVVPNYNYARYLPDRLGSVFAQDYPPFEVIVLDDASTDDSAAEIDRIAAAAGREVALVANARNSGNVFRQWRRGLDLAAGEFLWIAEADDSSAPAFLGEMVRRLQDDPEAGFCFCDSQAIGPDGGVMYESYKGYYREGGDDGLDQDGRFDAAEFLRRFLAVRNLVLNVSAVVWRTAHLRRVFQSLGDEAFGFTCAGDWRVYVESCRLGGAVHYVADPLNRHRRHDASVTHALDKREHLGEIMAVQQVALEQLNGDGQVQADIAEMRANLAASWAEPEPAG